MKQIIFILIALLLNCSNSSDFCSGTLTAPGCRSSKQNANEALVEIARTRVIVSLLEEEKKQRALRIQNEIDIYWNEYGQYGANTSYGNSGNRR